MESKSVSQHLKTPSFEEPGNHMCGGHTLCYLGMSAQLLCSAFRQSPSV